MSHQRKLSCAIGALTPIFSEECLPGDTWRCSTSTMLRFAPLVAPVMHQVSVYCHFFFVPNRIIWDNWNDFIFGGEDGTNASVAPFLTPSAIAKNTLPDYLGVPTGVAGLKHLGFLYAAYQKIWNEYYRDQNLQTSATDIGADKLTDGDNTSVAGLRVLRYRAWQHDYLTSALPFTQKGPEATIPLGTAADIGFHNSNVGATVFRDGNFTTTGNLNLEVDVPATGTNQGPLEIDTGGGVRVGATIDNSTNLFADLSNATAASINDLRAAFRLQEWLERNARAGSRVNEGLMAHFGVRSSDARLDRPEFIGGCATPVVISEVLQTSSTDATTPQANMSGHGISVGAGRQWKYYCEEHGHIIGIMSVMPKTAYQQGLPKKFIRFDKFDYAFPTFARLGEQPILNIEVYADGTSADDQVFGYTPRYSAYKYINDTVHGEFRDTLDFWHMGRKFASRPALNSDFVKCKPSEVGRVFAVPQAEEQQLYVYVAHRCSAKRTLPYYGTPTI